MNQEPHLESRSATTNEVSGQNPEASTTTIQRLIYKIQQGRTPEIQFRTPALEPTSTDDITWKRKIERDELKEKLAQWEGDVKKLINMENASKEERDRRLAEYLSKKENRKLFLKLATIANLSLEEAEQLHDKYIEEFNRYWHRDQTSLPNPKLIKDDDQQ